MEGAEEATDHPVGLVGMVFLAWKSEMTCAEYSSASPVENHVTSGVHIDARDAHIRARTHTPSLELSLAASISASCAFGDKQGTKAFGPKEHPAELTLRIISQS